MTILLSSHHSNQLSIHIGAFQSPSTVPKPSLEPKSSQIHGFKSKEWRICQSTPPSSGEQAREGWHRPSQYTYSHMLAVPPLCEFLCVILDFQLALRFLSSCSWYRAFAISLSVGGSGERATSASWGNQTNEPVSWRYFSTRGIFTPHSPAESRFTHTYGANVNISTLDYSECLQDQQISILQLSTPGPQETSQVKQPDNLTSCRRSK